MSAPEVGWARCNLEVLEYCYGCFLVVFCDSGDERRKALQPMVSINYRENKTTKSTSYELALSLLKIFSQCNIINAEGESL